MKKSQTWDLLDFLEGGEDSDLCKGVQHYKTWLKYNTDYGW